MPEKGGLGPQQPARADFDIEMELLIQAIYLKYHYDFRQYAASSLKRRLTAALTRFDCASLSLLQDRVLRDSRLFAQLLDYLTVQVSDLFRDPGYYRELRGSVLPLLRTYPSIKIWVAGCSTGEEVYSLAIVMHEEGLLERTLIYATDINPGALRRAEAGVFELSRMAGFSANYQAAGGASSLSDYYTAAYSGARFDVFLRRNVVFFDHSLATDSVFAEVQFVSCRNVLIYFDPPLKDRAIGLFRDALSYKGFLGLGSRESVRFTRHADSFKPYVEGERIYQKVSA